MNESIIPTTVRTPTTIHPWGDPERTLGMLCRLDRVTKGDTGWSATFYAMPMVHGNCFAIPIGPDDAEALVPGRTYLFELTGVTA